MDWRLVFVEMRIVIPGACRVALPLLIEGSCLFHAARLRTYDV